jgi:hypothetical protein
MFFVPTSAAVAVRKMALDRGYGILRAERLPSFGLNRSVLTSARSGKVGAVAEGLRPCILIARLGMPFLQQM